MPIKCLHFLNSKNKWFINCFNFPQKKKWGRDVVRVWAAPQERVTSVNAFIKCVCGRNRVTMTTTPVSLHRHFSSHVSQYCASFTTQSRAHKWLCQCLASLHSYSDLHLEHASIIYMNTYTQSVSVLAPRSYVHAFLRCEVYLENGDTELQVALWSCFRGFTDPSPA